MKRRLKKIVSMLVTFSMVFMLIPPIALADDSHTIEWVQVGSTIDFEGGELVGTVIGAPAEEGPGSVTVAVYGDSNVLHVHPPDGGTASFWWTLPLDQGEYDVTGNDLVEVSFDWWVENTRPWQNSLDIRLYDGENQVITLRTGNGGNNADSPAKVSYYASNSGDNNQPISGPLREPLIVPRLTKLAATIRVDLLEQKASIHLKDGDAILYESLEPLIIEHDQLTSLRIGASRGSGATWARFNPVEGIVWDEDNYGMRVDNIVIKAAKTDREKPVVYPTEIQIEPSGANLEYGEGSLDERQSVTFSATVLPANADDRTFAWEIDDPEIAAIVVNEDNTVMVTGVGEGTATLTAVSNMDHTVKASVPIHVRHIPAFNEPAPDFSDLLAEGYKLEFGSNFAKTDDKPLWIFDGGTYHKLLREDHPEYNFYFQFEASGSGNRGGKGDLPSPVYGSKVYVHFDWKVPAVTTEQNTFNLSLQDGGEVLLSLRTGTHNGERTIGVFAGPLPGPTGPDPRYFWESDRYHAFAYKEVDVWYTVGIELDFEEMKAKATLVPRDDSSAEPSVVEGIPFTGSQITSFVLTGERAAQNNIYVNSGLDNLYFFTKPLSNDTITEIVPYDFLPKVPETADENMWQSWTKVVYIGDLADGEEPELPDTIQVKTAGGTIETVGVIWHVAEIPWTTDPEAPLVYDNSKQGIYTYEGTILDEPGVAVNRMQIKPRLYIENRHKEKLTQEPISMEWLDRGVAAVPVNDGDGILVTWRLLASEYREGLTFNVYRNGEKINTSPITKLNYIDKDGKSGDVYVVEAIESGDISKPAVAWQTNYIDIPLQRPKARKNPALAYGANPADAQDIFYTANDMAVADVNGDGQYEIVVKWYPSQAQDPGLANRHTGETIFDAYTLEGKLLWRINLGINIVSSAHHSPFNFYDLDQDGKAEFMVKVADGTRVYLPKEDGTIDDLTDEPAYVIGDPNAVWVGGLQNPANNNEINNTALGRVASGPEYIAVFNGETGEPIDYVEYFAPYNINPNWGDNNNNRSDRFNAAVAYMPKNGEPGAEPYPTVIEVRGHYGPHFAAAYQLIDKKIVKIWEFRLAEWNAGTNQGNHNLQAADLDFDGYYEIVLGALALDHDGSLLWSTNGTRGTAAAGHGDALHAAAMLPDSDEIFVMSPHEHGPPNNVTLIRGSTGQPVWTYSANVGDVGRGMAANVTPLPGYEVWASRTPMYNIITGEVITTDVGGIGVMNKAPINFILYWDGDLLSEFFDGPDNYATSEPPSITKFMYDVATGESELVTLQSLSGAYSNNGTKANPGLIADIFGDWREEVLVRTADDKHLRIYTTDIPTDHVIYTLMHDPTYRMSANSQNSAYNQPTHLGFYLGEDIRDQVEARQLPVSNIFYTVESAAVSPSTISIRTDREITDVSVTVTLNGRTLEAIKKGDTVLAPDTDYVLGEVSADGKLSVTIKSEYLASLKNGDVLTFVFDMGQSASVIIKFVDPAPYTPPTSPTSPVTPDEDEDEGAADEEEPVTDEEPEEPVSDKPALQATVTDAERLRTKVRNALLAASPIRFQDVPETHWASKAIKYASQIGIVQGVPSGEFRGTDHVTRAQFATMIVRALGIDPTGKAGFFTDTNGHWAEACISALHQLGIVQGTDGGKFEPDRVISRAEMSAILARTLDLSASDGPRFTDTSGHWAAEAIDQLSHAGIVLGVGEGRFAPDATATRYEAAMIIVRMLDIVLDLGLDL